MHHVATTVAAHLLVTHRTRTNLTVVLEVALALLMRATHVTHAAAAVLLLLHEERHGLEEHLQVVLHLLLVGEVGPLRVLGVLLAEDLEVVFIAGGLVLELTDLLDLVVVNGKGLVVDRETLFGRGGLVGLLEADEGVELLLSTGRVHLEGLDLTVTGEEVAELILGHGRGEALNVEVASLLGALVLDGLAKALSLAVSALKCFFDIKLFVVGQGNTIHKSFAVKLLNGLLGAAGAILTIVLIFGVEADEGVRALIIAHVLHGLNTAKLGEEGLHIFLREVVGEVLGIDVVVDLAEVTLVTGLVADDLDAVGIAFSFKSAGG